MPNSKQYDLEERTFSFAESCRDFVNGLPRSLVNTEDRKQLIRSSGSIAANYIEANEALSKKDFVMRLKIAHKESKETILWLRLLKSPSELINEAQEIRNILSAIITKAG